MIPQVFLKSAYNYDRDVESLHTGTVNNEESMTQQSFAEEVDINTIVRRFGITGTMPQNLSPPTYELFTDIIDYHSAMNAVVAARETFDALPAAVRARFQNDPGAFVDFCMDEKNLDEMRKMGLAVAKAVDDNAAEPAAVAAKSESGDVT